MSFLALQLALLAALAAAAFGWGGLLLRRLEPDPLARAGLAIAAGLAILSLGLFAAASAGALGRGLVAVLLAAGAILAARETSGAEPSWPRLAKITPVALLAVPVLALALAPPLGFDETLYHLPTVRAFALSGAMPFVPELRYPIFPHLAESLQTALYLLGGDTATHLVAFVATGSTLLMLAGWTGDRRVRLWAPAVLVSAPLTVMLATSGYVDAPLGAFVTAAALALDRFAANPGRRWAALAGAMAGAAAGTKYLGLFFLAVAGVAVAVAAVRRGRLVTIVPFLLTAALIAGPWYARIVAATGNPLFPYAASWFGTDSGAWDPLPWQADESSLQTVARGLRLPWDGLFARERTGFQPPLSPWPLLGLPLLLWLAARECRWRWVPWVLSAWFAVWTQLPPDTRYLAAVLPVWSLATAAAFARFAPPFRVRWLAALAALALALSGPAYALYRLGRLGSVPLSPAAREQFLERNVPQYRAIRAIRTAAAPGESTYLCGAEETRYWFFGQAIGDHSGPGRYDRVLSADDPSELRSRLEEAGASWVLVDRRRCGSEALLSPPAAGPFVEVYRDEAAIALRLGGDSQEPPAHPTPAGSGPAAPARRPAEAPRERSRTSRSGP